MEGKERNQFVDELLEASLKHYGQEEPRLGLEARILASVRASGRRTTRLRWVWSLGATAVAVTIVGLALYLASHTSVPTTQVSQTVASKPGPLVTGNPAQTPMSAPVAPVSPRAKRGGGDTATAKVIIREQGRTIARVKRPEQFPTPTPLTEQEKLLLTYVEEVPSSVLTAQAREEPIHDLKIDELKIPPLEIKPMSSLNN